MDKNTPKGKTSASDGNGLKQHESVLLAAGLAADEEIDMAAVALALAALDYPGRDAAPYIAHLDVYKRQMKG